LLSYGFYDGILEHLITEYKHAGKIMASVVLSGLFESMLQSFDHPVLIPIPSSRSGKRSLGFDHMALVTAILGKRLNLQSIHLFRQKANSLYTVLSRSQRQQTSNLEIRKRAAKQMQKLLLQNRTFLILDDIYTTGNTCKRAQELLYTEFSVQASICVIARA
jgi:predicted amidophosphoribosyltransferase